MAWTTITYMCGHEDREQLYGPYRERDRYVEWASENRLCPACYKRQLKEQRSRDYERGKAIEAELGLPQLEGAPRQVTWATSIRGKAADTLRGLVKGWVGPSYAADHALRSACAADSDGWIAESLGFITSASRWIDRGDGIAREIWRDHLRPALDAALDGLDENALRD